MDYAANLGEIIHNFQTSIDFYILQSNYSNNSDAKNYLEEYAKIVNDSNLSIELKYAQIKELLQSCPLVAIKVVGNIDKISNLWKPNTSDIDKVSQFAYRKCLTILEQLKSTFEDPNIRKSLTNNELYALFVSYYELLNLFNSNHITNEILTSYEDRLYPIYHKFWAKNSTNVESFKNGEDFRFIIYATKSGNAIDEYKRDGVSCSYITQDEMGHFGNFGYILDIEGPDDIISICANDMGTSEQNNKRFIGNSLSTKLMTPDQLEKKCIKQNPKGIHGKEIYNEIYKRKFKYKAIFCFTFGEKELSDDYVLAKKLSEQTGLPFVEIDVPLYRTKNNTGSILTDHEEMTREEEIHFAERFLMKYYQAKQSNLELFEIQKFVEADLQLYLDMIIDIFLEQKRKGDIDVSNLFKIYEEAKKKRKDKAEEYNNYINEIIDLKEVILNLKTALENCNNDEIKAKISIELANIIRRIKALNSLIKNTNAIGLSSNNWINQNNPLVNSIMKDYTPFLTETFCINGENLELITGYKSWEQIEGDKQELLSLVIKAGDSMEKRTAHAKRVIEVRCAGYKTNSINNELATYKKSNSSLATMKINSLAYIDIASMDSILSDYEGLQQELVQGRQELKFLEDGKKVIAGADIYTDISSELSRWNASITDYHSQIASENQELESFRKQLQDLENAKKGYEAKNIISRFLARNELNRINLQIESIKRVISMTEQNISNFSRMIETIGQHKQESTEFFLKNYALEGMDMQQYKEFLEQALLHKEELMDVNKPMDLKRQIENIEQALANIGMTPKQEQQLRQALEQKRVQVGLESPKQTMQNNNELENSQGNIASNEIGNSR